MAEDSSGSSSSSALKGAVSALYYVFCLQVLWYACQAAYNIRLYAIEEYGRVIHEFDPYFNYRAAEYLWANGWKRFREWFDYMSWYPLGRPVGTTIYPGMQVTSVAIKQWILPDWSINDICCFVPAWFGVVATLATALLTYECCVSSKKRATILGDFPLLGPYVAGFLAKVWSFVIGTLENYAGTSFGLSVLQQSPPAVESAVFAALIMSIVPAHLLRSVGGGYDNESVATSAMVLTFWTWCKTLNTSSTVSTTLWATACALCYFYMVAAWGGYVFVLNCVAVHASLLVVLGRFSRKLYLSYSVFYVLGTALAIQVPVVGWTPLKSLEQMGPLLSFGCFQLLQICDFYQRKHKLKKWKDIWKLRIMVFAGAGILVAAVCLLVLVPSGYFGPVSARVRGLFVKHTKTGNPLVDSVAEHQPASPAAYVQYLHKATLLAPFGLMAVLTVFWTDSSSFLAVYAATAYYFSHRMVRLILLTAPIASVLGGIALGYAWIWMVDAIYRPKLADCLGTPPPPSTTNHGDPVIIRVLRLLLSVWMIQQVVPQAEEFQNMAHDMAHSISHPTIIQKARTKAGKEVLVDDYRQAYWWLRDNTPEDARVLAWWDYGYQITGIANRTTIADGNTWNHEHIALLGRILTSPEKDGHRIARHLADYILVWAGGGGDDLAKSPHLIRIANSVYRGLCSEPTCRSFGLTRTGEPSAQMKESLLYKLHSHKIAPGVEADRNRFKPVYQSPYGKVRIFKILKVSQESKEWVADPENRDCDVPGGWFCRGQYPPALQKILAQKRDFRQLEDFNVKKDHDADYQREYMENLNNPNKQKEIPTTKSLSPEEIDLINEEWGNNEMTTMMWELISNNRVEELKDYLKEYPALAHIRSEDGRGPMWWAHENGHTRIINILRKLGVSETRTDAEGITPLDLTKRSSF